MITDIKMTKCYDVQLMNCNHEFGSATFVYANNKKSAREQALKWHEEEIKNGYKHVLIDGGYMVEVYYNNFCAYIGFQLGTKKEVTVKIKEKIEGWKKIDKYKYFI